MEWRLLDALFLAVRNFANSNLAKDKATVDALWVCFIQSYALIRVFHMGRHGVYIHIGVGFCVARFGKMGNAKALNRGMGNRYRLPRFFRICTGKQKQKTAFPGSLKAQKLSVMRIKEKSLSWLALLLAVVFSVGFASCDKDDEDDGQGSGSIIGTWGYNLDTGYVHITFNEDGTGSEDEYDADGGMGEGYLYSASFSWRQDGDRIIIKFDDDDYSQVYEDVSVTSTTLTWTDPYGDREMMKRQSRIRN